MRNSLLWFLGAGISIVQIMIGNFMIFYGSLSPLLYFHIVFALLLLIISIYGAFKVKQDVKERILLGNIGLVILTSVIGAIYYEVNPNTLLVIIHLFLSLGLVSNFSVLYGMERGNN